MCNAGSYGFGVSNFFVDAGESNSKTSDMKISRKQKRNWLKNKVL